MYNKLIYFVTITDHLLYFGDEDNGIEFIEKIKKSERASELLKFQPLGGVCVCEH